MQTTIKERFISLCQDIYDVLVSTCDSDVIWCTVGYFSIELLILNLSLLSEASLFVAFKKLKIFCTVALSFLLSNLQKITSQDKLTLPRSTHQHRSGFFKHFGRDSPALFRQAKWIYGPVNVANVATDRS